MSQIRFEKKPIGQIYPDMLYMTRRNVREIRWTLELRHVLFSLLDNMQDMQNCHEFMTEDIVEKYIMSSFEDTCHFDHTKIKDEFNQMFDNKSDIHGTAFHPENCNYEFSDDTMFRMNVEEKMWLWMQNKYKAKGGDKFLKIFTKDDYYLKFEEEVLSWFKDSMSFISVSMFKKVIRTFVDLMKDLWLAIQQDDSDYEDNEGD